MPSERIRVAAIDCGTNSIRLLISDVTDGVKTDHVREMRIVRLGQDVDTTGRLADEAIGRAVSATRDFSDLISIIGADRIRFCATSAVRDAENAEQFAGAIEEVLGVRPEVLGGLAEARASFEGATREFPEARTMVVDIGGGSTELVVGSGGVIEWSHSFDLGSVRLTERFFRNDPPSVDEIVACAALVDAQIAEPLAQLAPVESFIGVAGTVTTVAAHALQLPSYDSARIHGAELALDVVQQACLSLTRMSVADRRALPFMHPGRADVIGAGAVILDRAIDLLPAAMPTMTVSEHDILDGIVWGAVEASH